MITEPIEEQDVDQFRLLVSQHLYTPVVVDDVAFVVGIWEDKNLKFVNAQDFFMALGIPKIHIEETIYHWLNKFDLKLGVDFVLQQGVDPVIAKPAHIFTIATAHRIATSMATPKAKAAVEFLDCVIEHEELDTVQMMLHDIVVMNVLFPMPLVAEIFSNEGYNDHDFNEQKLTILLKQDRFLTKAARPARGHESKFVRTNNQNYLTGHGLHHLLRRYLSYTIDQSLSAVASYIEAGNMLRSYDLFDAERVMGPDYHHDTE